MKPEGFQLELAWQNAPIDRRGGISAIRVINSVFSNHHMIIAGYANGYGAAPGDVRNDKRALREAVALGERLCELIKLLKRNREN